MKQTEQQRILIVEDDVHIAEGLKLNLTLQGYEAAIARSGTAGLKMWKEWNPQLIVLDIMLPGLDGWSVLRHIRLEEERLPILILSAKGAPDDRVKGFSFGVDDYLAKPFNLEEFLLRVQRLLTRASWSKNPERGGGSEETTESMEYRFGGNTIDWNTLTASCRQGTIQLTEQEAKLLKVFILNRGKPLSRKLLLEVGWGYSGVTSTRTVDNFIVRLRKYFEEDPQNPVYFRSLRSVGYLFDHP
ncbi:MAG: DNA-binding response regulator [Syntrophobacterales bacterium CG_4_8_14_3_um_filter_58_8]|nr:MAG: DNA-binding response regulator [Syntrophaceae bacterium CG2_30_58_14]PIV01688.1 MAG: DNA-binding response regulator [Syntrophobacterales bacterium CG03_land_8_20_14_0_80_58_14]PJC72451.1 MAG: DNA-binding response regulator [Syntrophobacterales bacterium CG_4_8_14_3_um_filter_58_8]